MPKPSRSCRGKVRTKLNESHSGWRKVCGCMPASLVVRRLCKRKDPRRRGAAAAVAVVVRHHCLLRVYRRTQQLKKQRRSRQLKRLRLSVRTSVPRMSRSCLHKTLTRGSHRWTRQTRKLGKHERRRKFETIPRTITTRCRTSRKLATKLQRILLGKRGCGSVPTKRNGNRKLNSSLKVKRRSKNRNRFRHDRNPRPPTRCGRAPTTGTG